MLNAQSHAMTPRGYLLPLCLASHGRSASEAFPFPPSAKKMPVNILAQALDQGIDSIPYGWTILKAAVVVAVVYALKRYFNGVGNSSERKMHSKVVMVTVSV